VIALCPPTAVDRMPGGRRVWDSSTACRDDFQAWMESELGHEDSPAAQQGVAAVALMLCPYVAW
jgi:hypothetical protein